MSDEGGVCRYEQESPGKYMLFVLKNEKIIGSIIIGDKSLSMTVKQAVDKGLVFPQAEYDNAEKIAEKLTSQR